MAEIRNHGTLTGKHAGAARTGMPVRTDYDPRRVRDADEAAADDAVAQSRAHRAEAMRRLGVTQADIDAANQARNQPRTVTVADVIGAVAPVPAERCPACSYLLTAAGHAVACG